MWYTKNVGPGVENVARELALHISCPGTENWKELGHFFGYLKYKNTKGIIIRRPKRFNAVMF